MATATAFNSLPIPLQDEQMEMSSPANRPLDDDIDIDFDDYPGGVQVTDDEQMVEATDPTRPGTGTDDMMEDDILPGEETLVQEEVMQDDDDQLREIQHLEDEELIDYGEDEIQDQPVDDALVPAAVDELQDTTAFEEQHVDEHIPPLSGVAMPEVPQVTDPNISAQGQPEDEALQNPIANSEDLLDPSFFPEEAAYDEQEPGIVPSEHEPLHPDESVPTQPEDQSAVAEQGALPPISTTAAYSAQADTPGTPTDTGLHPMFVRYGDLRMPLFKSRRQPDGLLKDDNLASLSLAELIKSCRQRLAIKTGENLSEDQELMLGFDNLGLMLVEDARAAFETSLNDVLEVFLHLHRNDAAEDIPPLSLTVSLQLKFTSSFSILKQAAASGQGMSSFGLQAATDDEYFHHEHGDAFEHEGGSLQEDEYDEVEHGEYFNVDEQADTTEDQDRIGQANQDTGDYNQGEYHEGHYEDTTNKNYLEQSEQPPPGLDELLKGEHQLTETVNETLDHATATGTDVADKDNVTQLGTALDPTAQSESKTVQGNNTNANTGEYEDLIDWDDDTLTSDISAATSNGREDFSTFSTEFDEAEGTTTTAKADEISLEADTSTQHLSELLEGEHTDPLALEDQQQFGSEDYLNEAGENDYIDKEEEDGDEGDGEQYHLGEEEQDFNEEEYYDEADTFAEQQDGVEYTEHDFGEEDDQYHTAQDLLQDDFYEHGPQHELQDQDGLDNSVDTVVHYPVQEYDEGETREDLKDDIGFDDDHYEQQEDTGKVSQTDAPGAITSKRSFDEFEDEDDLEADEPEVKKSRAA